MGKTELDPQEILKRQIRAKCRFKAVARMALANSYWLIESTERYEGIEDVKRRVAQAVRGTNKKKQLLNITDKALLNKPAAERTDQEKKYIYRIIGGLKCFKRYPDIVKMKLAAVTYFKYYGPYRVIVRTHHEAHALYFIVSGDVVVSQLVFDHVLKQHLSVDVGVMHAGDMFGEVSLLHNIPRTATCTTASHCELLVLMKEDFKHVLQASVQKEWREVQRAMSAFTYFEGFDEVARREGCIVAKIKSFEANETILGDGAGVPNFVYFLLSGKCQMIESLNVIVNNYSGRKTYKLYDPYVPKPDSEEDFDMKYFSKVKDQIPPHDPSADTPDPGSSKMSSLTRDSRNILHVEKRNSQDSSKQSNADETQVKCENKMKTQDENAEDTLKSGAPEISLDSTKNKRISVRFSVEKKTEIPKYQTYFMQVCQFNPGATFGFGENMRDRRIVALCPVQCMLLPKMWLLQRNTANIWTRVQHYLDKKIPSKKQLFNNFVSERRWQEYREGIVKNVVEQANTVNWTSLHDVPYSIRLQEMLDI